MKIIIENTRFDYNIGCRLLKTKYRNTPFNGLEDIWEDIVPITFKEITTEIQNIEQRRIAVGCLGLENIYKEVNPTLIKSETISKETFWVGENGELIKKNFEDTYELYLPSLSILRKNLTIYIKFVLYLLSAFLMYPFLELLS